MSEPNRLWRLPIDCTHRVVASAGPLTFVGGAGDFDHRGVIRNPDDLLAQLRGTIDNIEAALRVENCALADVVRLKAFYQSDGGVNEWEVIAALANAIALDPLPVISVLPVPQQAFQGQKVQVQAIAERGFRKLADIRVARRPIPARERSRFRSADLTAGLRAGELITTMLRTAADEEDAIAAPGDAPAQTHAVMSSLRATLAELGASMQDAIKKEGYYFGTTREHWVPMARIRGSYFAEPGPVATMVPCHVLSPADAATKIELIAMRERRGGFDKYIPREDCWPARVWDWPIPLPYRQAIRLRDMVWLGGQVPAVPYDNSRERVLPGDLLGQTVFTMTYIDDLLRGFARRAADLAVAVCYFRSDGSAATTRRFVDTLAACIGTALPPLTLVPQPHMHTPQSTVEIWGVTPG
jgi:enamine deaminase RidA (YjgF/YER057c/UK114 family)